MYLNHYPWCIGTRNIGTPPSVQGRGHPPPTTTPNVQDASPGPPLYRALPPSLQGSPSWDVQTCSTVQGNPLTGRYVQTCSKWSTYGRQAGGWHPTGMLSCSEKSLVSFQRPIVTSDKGDFQIKKFESLCWCCTWDIAVFHIAVHHISPYDITYSWCYIFRHECIYFHMNALCFRVKHITFPHSHQIMFWCKMDYVPLLNYILG